MEGTEGAGRKRKQAADEGEIEKEKTEEHLMCVGDCIDSDTDRFTAKGIL